MLSFIKKEGILRIAVLSFDVEVQALKNAIKDYESSSYPAIKKFLSTDLVGDSNYYINHRYMYNYDIINSLLSEVGF